MNDIFLMFSENAHVNNFPSDNDDDEMMEEEYQTADEFSLQDVDSTASFSSVASATEQYLQEEFHIWHETKLLLGIALPSVAVQFSVLFTFPQTASIVGRKLGTHELAGFSLGSLVGNLTCLSVLVGALTAADTLMPRAYSVGDYPEIGRLAVRGLIMCSFLLSIPVVPLCTIMEQVFDKLGQEEEASHLASQWIKVYLMGVPAMLLFRVLQSFLNAQHQVWHLVVASTISSFFIHPFLLKMLIPMFGFLGSSLAIALTQFAMAIWLILFLRLFPTYKAESWPKFSWNNLMETFSPQPMLTFLSLSLGGVLSLSEWWFWETVCFIVGSFGIVPLCVHTIAYNLVPLLFMIPLGLSIGLTVRMGHVLAHNVTHAKLMAGWCMGLTMVAAASVSLALYRFRLQVASIFTNDVEVLQGCEDIWPKLCYYIFVIYIFGINSAILRALGLQWRLAVIVFGCLWFCTLPTIIYIAIFRGRGIDGVWSTLPITYTLMQLLLALAYLRADWKLISIDIQNQRANEKPLVEVDPAQELVSSEKTSLLRSMSTKN